MKHKKIKFKKYRDEFNRIEYRATLGNHSFRITKRKYDHTPKSVYSMYYKYDNDQEYYKYGKNQEHWVAHFNNLKEAEEFAYYLVYQCARTNKSAKQINKRVLVSRYKTECYTEISGRVLRRLLGDNIYEI